MSVPAATAAFLGGVGMFLLGMRLMTEGLKLAAGSALERVLASSTRTRLRGLGSGALLTALVQSSSAVRMATIGFVNAGPVSLGQALWLLYGANVGTTMTAWLATIGATPNAKRAAAGHVAFNVPTAVVALALLPWLVTAIAGLRQGLGLPPSPAAKLALFHTTFNLLGVVLMWPLSARLARELGRRFRSGEEDEARPQHLDDNVLAVPALALEAMEQEVRRFGEMAAEAARRALTGEFAPTHDPRPSARLGNAIAESITRLNRQSMGPESARRLPEILRVVRYWEAVRELAADAAAARAEPGAAGALARFDAAFR